MAVSVGEQADRQLNKKKSNSTLKSYWDLNIEPL
jgi:hypothetical protein